MRKSLILWATLIFVTALNVHYFLSRWAELPLTDIPNLLTGRDTSSLFMGVGLGVVALSVFNSLLRKRWFTSCLLCVAVGCLLVYAGKVPVFKPTVNPDWKMFGVGAALALLSLRAQEQVAPVSQRMQWSSFAFYVLASLNVFLYVAPFTSFTPAYVQDSKSPLPSLAYFYYGSVHSDISMVSVFFRRVINSFFEYPSINATILTSILLVSLGLGCAALAFEMLFGKAWGWMLLLAAWTDKYIMAGALASSVVGMPILSVGSVFLLAVWALVRPRGILSWKEATGLGLFNALSLLYSLYSYSAARIPWLIGSAVAAAIVLVRGAIPCNLRGLFRAIVTAAPSLLLIACILVFIFESDAARFKAQLLISPRPEQIIKNVHDYPVKVGPIHDVDSPIWWGTGRPEGLNLTVYWRRTPGEILEKASWFMSQFTLGTPVEPYLILLGALSLLVVAGSGGTFWQGLAVASGINLLGAFAAFILAQDASAYRRALGTNLMILVAIVALFASRRRQGAGGLLSIGLCVGLCLLKAPSEMAPLLDSTLHGPLCVACHEHFNARAIVNSPVFQAVNGRPLYFVVEGRGLGVIYTKCATLAIDSHEMKQLSPGLQYLMSNERSSRELFESLKPGEVLVVTCPMAPSTEDEMRAICAHTPPFGKFIGAIDDPNRDPFNPAPPRTKWVFIEK